MKTFLKNSCAFLVLLFAAMFFSAAAFGQTQNATEQKESVKSEKAQLQKEYNVAASDKIDESVINDTNKVKEYKAEKYVEQKKKEQQVSVPLEEEKNKGDKKEIAKPK